MNKHITSILMAAGILALPLSVGASNHQTLQNQIQFYQYSVNQSSVSHLLSEQRKLEKMALIEQAQQQADAGNFRTAEQLLKRVGQNLYVMNSPTDNMTNDYRTAYNLNAMMQAIESILPQAQQIALEKQLDQRPLNRVMESHQLAKAALKSNDVGTATRLMQSTYRDLKEHVADMRSGDRLMINLPAQDSREGWMDAAHRYLDWRYFNRQLITTLQDQGLNTTDIINANQEADQMYDLASNIALQGDWEQAVDTVDQAYRILEKAWTNVGVDIGI